MCFSHRFFMRIAALVAMFLLVTGCAATGTETSHEKDPYESFNRKIFAFNDGLDRRILKPVAKTYDKVMPQQANKSVTNFFNNLGDVGGAVNAVLQAKPKKAAADTGRFLINTTAGVLGIFDVASRWGIKSGQEDFGQTLERWGVGSGPYIVLPIFGGRTVRDGASLVVDTYLNPVNFMDDVDTHVQIGAAALNIVDIRADVLAAESLLKGDRYSLFRNAYFQRRELLINDGKVVDDFGSDAFEDDIFED